MRLTVGPLPPAVYWRRRLIVLGGALLMLFVVAQACMASVPASDSAEESPSPSEPASSASPAAPANQPPDDDPDGEDPDGDQPDDGDPDDDDPDDDDPDTDEVSDASICTDDEISVAAEAAQETFAVGASVRFTIRIAHDAERVCQRDVGGQERDLYLVRGSGADHVWSSQICANPTGSEVVELADGWEREHHIDFTGRGGSTCDTELEPGEYQLRAGLGTARSDPVTITLE